MTIIFLKCKDRLFIEMLIIYILKYKLSDRILLINNIKFFLVVKNKIIFFKAYVILFEVTSCVKKKNYAKFNSLKINFFLNSNLFNN
ncbi:MAG TPA: hypothetical protein ACYCC7_00375 [Candidatus Azoamicus sp. MARI]